jgi:hypothetical protein
MQAEQIRHYLSLCVPSAPFWLETTGGNRARGSGERRTLAVLTTSTGFLQGCHGICSGMSLLLVISG